CGDDDVSPDGGVDAGHDAGDVDGGEETDGGPEDGGVDAETDAGSDAGADAGTSRCPAIGARTRIEVPEGVLDPAGAAGLTWTCDNLYVLEGIVVVYSANPATPQVLAIEPGTVVQGNSDEGTRGFLVVSRNGRLIADGDADEPIVFTSERPVGDRARDDWGGITMLGRAFAGASRRTEGFPVSTTTLGALDPYLAYGPLEGAEADDAWSCGTLRYVRVEFASFNAGGAMGNESNALQLYSCGRGTTIDYVQSHLSGDDGIEVFGGTVDFRHVVITGASDDLFDWDDGWRGRAQFLVGQQHDDVADFGIEAGGSSETPPVAPDPRLFNVTLVGANGAAGKIGARFRGASRGYLRNFVFLGFTAGFVDIGGATAAGNLLATPPTFSLRHSVFGQGSAPVAWPTGGDDASDGDLIEQDVLTSGESANRVIDPQLEAPFDLVAPNWMPRAGAPLDASFAEAPSEREGEPAFFDTTATFVGAFEPGGTDWTTGWTAYPED
ncbi:MAG: hypothetical protein R3B99_37140, partial [Polyangiales bacterium]